MDCPFCLDHESAQKVRFRNELVVFIQEKRYQGALKHSGVIVPLAHKETVFDLSDAELLATFRLLAEVKQWLDANFTPDGYNLGWNCGAVAGQEVFHAHLHVIPRFWREPLAGKGIRAYLKSEANIW